MRRIPAADAHDSDAQKMERALKVARIYFPSVSDMILRVVVRAIADALKTPEAKG